MQIFSFSPFGYEGALVTVEIDLRRGIPAVDIVGLADGAVKESRERMQAAIRNSGFDFPSERVLISLSPADLKKEGAGFDLPIALGVLVQNSGKDFLQNEPILVMGELELSGRVRAVKGIHAAVSTAISYGIKKCIVPLQNAEEAREVAGAKIFGTDTLTNAFLALENENFFTSKTSNPFNENSIPSGCEEVSGILFLASKEYSDYSEIKGQYNLIRALQIAAAGGHNLLAVGAPGCGKTMAIQKFPNINPILSVEQAQSVTRIWSLAGLIKETEPLIRIPPFRVPHQTASIEGICGGGINCRPGEISLAHNGVLFLDEAAEFKSSILQMLRVPLENNCITLCRAGRSTVYPANFQLIMAVNPCPCGNYGSRNKICLCSAKSVEQYWKKFSSPLLDRVDLRVFVENDKSNTEPRTKLINTYQIRQGIANAIKMQKNRQTIKNAKLTPSDISNYCKLNDECKNQLDLATNRYSFSPRGVSSCLKTARTIADIEGCVDIKIHHLKEAIMYRKLCNNMIPNVEDFN